jgi:phosphatidylserine decarboxylase
MDSDTPDTPSQGFLAHLFSLVRETTPPMHPAGRPFVLAGAAATLLVRRVPVLRALWPLPAVLTGWCAWFFRVPRRVAPTRTGVVVAPADGTVSAATVAAPPAELALSEQKMLRVSIFLTVLDVHVQRIPVAGEVEKVHYRPGKFLSADLDKASEDNERNTVLIRTENGTRIPVVQIAGLVARRIVCSAREGERVAVGANYGLIRFGSRVDTYLPQGSRVLVEPGQRTVGGETVLAELPGEGTAA